MLEVTSQNQGVNDSKTSIYGSPDVMDHTATFSNFFYISLWLIFTCKKYIKLLLGPAPFK
jgi:hypothetical protein